MTSPARKNTVDRAFLQKLVLWPILVASVALVITELSSACLDDLPPLVDAAAFDDAISPCGDGLVATNQNGMDAGESCDPGDASTYPGCVDCHLGCPDGVLDDAGHHCFFSAGTAKTFQEATNACAIRKGHIVTIASAHEADFAEASGVVDLKVGYWLGVSYTGAANGYVTPLIDEPGVPTGGTSCPGCFSFGVGGDFPPHPTLDASAVIRECLVAQNDGTTRRWLSVPCATNTTDFAVLCEREPPGRRIIDCAGNFQCTTTFNTEGRKRYLISLAEAVLPDEAVSRCSIFPGGRLAVFDTREEREDLAREIQKRLPNELTEPTTLWIGLALDKAGVWRWDDGKPEESDRPRVWGSGQPDSGPNAGRAFLRIAKQFDTQLAYASDSPDAGTTPRGYICERAP